MPREQVLIVLHSDGWVEAYAEKHVDFHIVNRPHLESTKGSVLVDELMDLTMPEVYKKLHEPGHLRSTEMLRKVTPIQLAHREWDLELFKTLDKIQARES